MPKCGIIKTIAGTMMKAPPMPSKPENNPRDGAQGH